MEFYISSMRELWADDSTEKYEIDHGTADSAEVDK
jgi:hypothetical protein